MVYIVTFTVSEIQAVIMLKPHFAYPFVFGQEFVRHAVGMWRRNLAPENHWAAMVKKSQDNPSGHV